MASPNISIRAGNLKRPLFIQQPSVVGGIQKWITFAKVWGDVAPGAGLEMAQQLGPTNTVTSTVLIRYRAGVVPKMRISFRGRFLEIIAVINVDEQDRELQLTCREAPV